MTDMKIEAKLGEDWHDLTRYMQAGGEHAPRWLPRHERKPLLGPRRTQRRAQLVQRMLTLDPKRPHNPVVAAVRAQTDLNELDKAVRNHKGKGGAGPLPPNRRLEAFGMSIQLTDDRNGYRLIGGTQRQRACYVRAVSRWMRAGAGA